MQSLNQGPPHLHHDKQQLTIKLNIHTPYVDIIVFMYCTYFKKMAQTMVTIIWALFVVLLVLVIINKVHTHWAQDAVASQAPPCCHSPHFLVVTWDSRHIADLSRV